MWDSEVKEEVGANVFDSIKKGNGVVTYPCVTVHSGPDDRKYLVRGYFLI